MLRGAAVVSGLGVYGAGVYVAYRYNTLKSTPCSCGREHAPQSVTEGERMERYDALAPKYDKGESYGDSPIEYR